MWRPAQPADKHATKLVADMAKAQGEAVDSEAMYAARIVDCIRSIWLDVEAGDIDGACKRACFLGELATELRFKMSTADAPNRGGQASASKQWPTEKMASQRKKYSDEVRSWRTRGFSLTNLIKRSRTKTVYLSGQFGAPVKMDNKTYCPRFLFTIKVFGQCDHAP